MMSFCLAPYPVPKYYSIPHRYLSLNCVFLNIVDSIVSCLSLYSSISPSTPCSILYLPAYRSVFCLISCSMCSSVFYSMRILLNLSLLHVLVLEYTLTAYCNVSHSITFAQGWTVKENEGKTRIKATKTGRFCPNA